MSTCCNTIPTYNVTSVAIDTTTGITTVTLNTTSLATGKFNMCFKLSGQRISNCWTETLNIVVGSGTTATTYATVLGRDGNLIKLGQLAHQINCCKVVHANLTSNPSGNIMILDKVPCCAFTASLSSSNTTFTVSS